MSSFAQSHTRTLFKTACCAPSRPAPDTRRRFIQLAALGAGASLLGVSRAETKPAGVAIEALLLSCMDYRLMDNIEQHMSGRNLRDQYDHIALAGASLGALTTRYPAWNKTFWQHLDIAVQLHRVRRVIVMDHRDCGAYKVILGAAHAKTPETERAAHARQLATLKTRIHQHAPALQVETLLMGMDGSVETVG